MPNHDTLVATQKSLDRVSTFDVNQLPRSAELGREFSFEPAAAAAARVIELFGRIPASAVEDFPDNELNTLRSHADQFYQLLSTALAFSPTAQTNPVAERAQIITQIENQYASTFGALLPYISYTAARTTDFSRIEEQGRAAVQGIRDETSALVAEITTSHQNIQKTLDDVRAAAAEQGVTQQARYFKDEADRHETQAVTWWKWTLISAGCLIVYAIGSMFIHLIPWLTPTTTYDAFQLGASKVLIFVVAAYVVLTCGRNFLSQKHNAIVNRHRQNALQTFKTLVDAGSTPQSQDIVLTHAAASIFEPQETGYAKQNAAADSALSASAVLKNLSSPVQ